MFEMPCLLLEYVVEIDSGKFLNIMVVMKVSEVVTALATMLDAAHQRMTLRLVSIGKFDSSDPRSSPNGFWTPAWSR